MSGEPNGAGGMTVRGPDGWYADAAPRFGQFTSQRVELPDPAEVKVFHIPSWKQGDDRGRISALRQIAVEAGRDPRMATVAVGILRAAKAAPRDYEKQAAALLRWVQHEIYYVNEPGERLQDPFYTLQVRYGDCDDMALLLASLCESFRLPWRFAISGNRGRDMIRWVEGEPYPSGVTWSHIYLRIGWPAFTPKEWRSAEPTLRGVPLGWDVVDIKRKNGRVVLPELAGVEPSPAPAPMLPVAAPRVRPFWPDVSEQIRQRLHPRALIPAVVAGLVIGAVAEGTRRGLRKAWGG